MQTTSSLVIALSCAEPVGLEIVNLERFTRACFGCLWTCLHKESTTR